jgi:peptidoglycan/xylan/chitin deacetylase (PgdA/CDA1 family)
MNNMGKKYIILKVDDYGGGNDETWKVFGDIILRKHIKANLGINAINRDGSNFSLKNRFKTLIKRILCSRNTYIDFWKETKKMIDTKSIELWNHSYSHDDFQKIDDETIKKLIVKNQEVVKKYLGNAMIAFGAPFNKISISVQKFLESQNEIKIWLYGYTDRVHSKMSVD